MSRWTYIVMIFDIELSAIAFFSTGKGSLVVAPQQKLHCSGLNQCFHRPLHRCHGLGSNKCDIES